MDKHGENLTGTITKNTTSSATITNKYTAQGHVDIMAYKAMSGDTLQAGAFAFQLLDGQDTVIDTALNDAVDTEPYLYDEDSNMSENPHYGTAPVYFRTLYYTQDDIGIHTYKIREVRGSDSSIVYDSHTETVTVTVSDAGLGMLSAEVTYDGDGALFTNSKTPGALKVSKTVMDDTPATADREFTYTLTLTDAQNSPVSGTYPASGVTGLTQVTVGTPFTLRAGEECTITGLPHGASYKVEEADKEGWTCVSQAGSEGTIEAGMTKEAAFINTYQASGDAVITAHKTLNGGNLDDYEFTFQLLDANDVVLQTVTQGEHGNIIFDALQYDSNDIGQTYTYYIKEVADPMLTGVAFDDSVYEVNVSVTDDGAGHITANVTYPRTPEFTNSAGSGITVNKIVSGNAGNKNKDFAFTLKLEGTHAASAAITYTKGSQSGNVTLDDGVYAFTLSHNESIVFDGIPRGTVYTITETDANAENYVTTYSGARTGTLTEPYELTVTNSRTIAVPTGVNRYYGWLALLGAAAAGAGYVVFKKRRHTTA